MGITEVDEVGAQVTDEEIADRVRAGEESAFDELFRRHRAAALRVARSIIPGEEDDAVAEAFLGLLCVLRDGGGPTRGVRAYILASARNRALRRTHLRGRVRVTDVPQLIAEAGAVQPDHLWVHEGDLLVQAFRALTRRQQLVLWAIEVEGRPPRDLTTLLGCDAAAVSAVAYRARRRLRDLYFEQLVETPQAG
ncbi:RNA polymerase sigma factor [Pimelobacter simplex]|uniref:RNA polymerase sigma factor n=1 Tax=Nocardioides simplex TaxID=2045 RepID=UPI003AADE634